VIDKDTQIVVGADHYGLPLKNVVRDYLIELGYKVHDMGVDSDDPVDYPDIGAQLAEAVGQGRYQYGILVCGTGAGMAIVANKVPGVRAVYIGDPYTAERARASNNANVITMGSQTIAPQVAQKLIDIWLQNDFQGGRSTPKVAKIDQLDDRYRKT
jgi:ribose 5-phosphate isomerase B